MSLEKFALLTKDLFDGNITTVLARSNYKIDDFTEDNIIVDSLTPAQPLGNIESFDDVNEIYNYGTKLQMTCTVDFYGNNAEANAFRYMALLRSQKATELKSQYSLNVFNPTGVTKLNELIGTTQYNRYQIELNISYIHTEEIDTLRIDEVGDMEYLIEK